MSLPDGPLNSPKPTTSILVGGAHNTTPPAPADGQVCALQVDDRGNLLVNVAVGGGGGSSNVNIADVNGNPPALTNPLPVELSDGTNAFGTAGNPLSVNVLSGGGSNASVGTNGAPAPTSATEIGIIDGSGNLQGASASNPVPVAIVSGELSTVTVVQPTGTNLHAVIDSGSTTTVTQATGTNLHTVVDSGTLTAVTAITNALPTGSNVIGHVIADTGSTTAVTGNVTVVQPTGTNLHAVLDATSTTTVTQATGTNLHTVVDSGTLTAVTAITNALPAGANVIGHVIADTGSTTAVTGNVTVVQGTGTNLHTVVDSGHIIIDSGSTTAVTGTVTVAGAKTNNNAAPGATNVGTLPGLANAAVPTWTEGDQVTLSVDLNGGIRTTSTNISEVTTSWTSATAQNTALTLTVIGYGTAIFTASATATITGGIISFEVSDASTNWYPVFASNTGNGGVLITYPINAGNQSFSIPVLGYASVRLRLSTVISGTGTVSVGLQASSGSPTPSAINALMKSNQAAATVLDNRPNVLQVTDGSNNAASLLVADEVYGGAFSGAADTARQGWSKARTPTVFKTASVAATTTGNTAVWTPGTGNKFRLLGFQITAQGLAATATGVVTVSFQDASTGITFGTYDVDVPAVAGVVSGTDDISAGWITLGSFGILSAAANNVLNFNISAAGAGTVGTYRVNVCGTEE